MNKKDLKLLTKNLPSVQGILGKKEYFNSAVLIPLINIDDEYNFLFEKRAANIRQAGEICFPGGEIDLKLDNDFIQAAIRETDEEIGIPGNKIKILGFLDTLIGPRGITIDPVIAEVKIKSLDECIIDKKEVEKIFLVPVSFFEKNKPEEYKVISNYNYTMYNEEGKEESLIPQQNNDDDGTYKESIRKVIVYKTHGEIIWGITARLIYEVVKKTKHK